MLNKIALVLALATALAGALRRLSEWHSRRPPCRKASAPPIITATARAEGLIQSSLHKSPAARRNAWPRRGGFQTRPCTGVRLLRLQPNSGLPEFGR